MTDRDDFLDKLAQIRKEKPLLITLKYDCLGISQTVPVHAGNTMQQVVEEYAQDLGIPQAKISDILQYLDDEIKLAHLPDKVVDLDLIVASKCVMQKDFDEYNRISLGCHSTLEELGIKSGAVIHLKESKT